MMHKIFKARKVQIGTLNATSTNLSWMCLFVVYDYDDTNHDNDIYTQKDEDKDGILFRDLFVF